MYQFTLGPAVQRSLKPRTALSTEVSLQVLDCMAKATGSVPWEEPWSHIWVVIEEMHHALGR